MKYKIKADGTAEGWSFTDEMGTPMPLAVHAATIELLPGLPPLAKIEVSINDIEIDDASAQLYTRIGEDRYRLTLEE